LLENNELFEFNAANRILNDIYLNFHKTWRLYTLKLGASNAKFGIRKRSHCELNYLFYKQFCMSLILKKLA